MKSLLFASLLLLTVSPAFAIARTVVVVDDVIRMSKAGVGDDEIIAFVQKSRQAFDVTGDDVLAMTDAHVSRAVVKAVIDESASRMRSERRDESERPRTRTVYVSPWYDPFDYGPSAYFSFGLGPRYYGSFYGGYYGGFYRGSRHFRRH